MGAASDEQGLWIDRLLILLAVAYYAVVALAGFGPALRSSADEVADGQVWLLLTSSLEVAGEVPALQLLLGIAVTALVIVREGPRLWWVVAIAGHLGSALLAYALIGIGVALDAGSAERAADDADYGVSAILSAGLGALLASGILALRRRRALADRLALAVGALGLLAMLPISFGWYDVEHPLAYAIGFGVSWYAIRRRSFSPARAE